MVGAIEHDRQRMLNGIVSAGIPKESLDSYVQRTSDSSKFYRYPDGTLNDLSKDVFHDKYSAPGETGPLLMWDRVARAMASVEDTKEKQEQSYKNFLGMMLDYKFVPGGRIMHGAGRADARRQPTMSNCYVDPIPWGYRTDRLPFAEEILGDKARVAVDFIMEQKKNMSNYHTTVLGLRDKGLSDTQIRTMIYSPDSIEGIYQWLTDSALVYRSGGGVGVDLSVLRPQGTDVNSTINKAPGVTAFMDLFSNSTNTVSQQGRRGALMLTLRASHPDIYNFIKIKNDKKRALVKHANISVLIDDELMHAIETDSDYRLFWDENDILSKNYGHTVVEKVVKARDLWDKIVTMAHETAEPGIIFWDSMKKYHNGEYATPLSSTNPCGEQPLAEYTACNLGNINISKLVVDGKLDESALEKVTRTATRFMDNVITYNRENHAMPIIMHGVDNDRRVGLGVTGLADALLKMGIKYDTQEGIDAAEKIFRVIRNTAYNESIELAKERGAFPLFNWEGYSKSRFVQSLPQEIQDRIKHYGIRNVTVLTLPPVGTGSIVAESSSGIEPIFELSYFRKVKSHDSGTTEQYKVFHPEIKKMFGGDDKLPDIVVTAHKIDPYFRVKMQGVIQKYIDTAISSTINLPEDVSVDTVKQIYMAAYKEGLKGVTVYREGSREGVLETEGHAAKGLEKIVRGSIGNPMKIPATLTSRYFIQPSPLGTLHGHIDYVSSNGHLPAQVFATIGNSGGQDAALLEAMTRMISKYIREGGELKSVISQLMPIGGTDVRLTQSGNVASVPQALAIGLAKFEIARRTGLLDDLATGKLSGDEFDARASKLIKASNGDMQYLLDDKKEKVDLKDLENMSSGPPCPECGSPTHPQGGCPVCSNCGWSKC